MTKLGISVAVIGALALVGGCTSGSHRGGGGSTDAGPITLMESGPGSDSGPATPDSGPVLSPDGGSGGTCSQPLMMFPAMDGPRCSAATKTCLDACMDSTCLTNCLSMDMTTPLMDSSGNSIDCSFCWNYEQFYCLDSSGCHSQVAAWFCCVQNNCSMASDPASCAMTMCSTQNSALQTCAGSSSCFSSLTGGDFAVCFPAG